MKGKKIRRKKTKQNVSGFEPQYHWLPLWMLSPWATAGCLSKLEIMDYLSCICNYCNWNRNFRNKTFISVATAMHGNVAIETKKILLINFCCNCNAWNCCNWNKKIKIHFVNFCCNCNSLSFNCIFYWFKFLLLK